MLLIEDKEYSQIVREIIKNDYFKKTYNIEHHGISRLEHSLKVSYYSYKIAKKINLNYIAVARGGLLHDFFLEGNERNKIKKFTDTFVHPKKALITTQKYFKISNIEENIIVSHMFPIYFSIPKYRESVLVNIVDKVIGSNEMIKKYKYKLSYRFNYLFLLMLIFMTKN